MNLEEYQSLLYYYKSLKVFQQALGLSSERIKELRDEGLVTGAEAIRSLIEHGDFAESLLSEFTGSLDMMAKYYGVSSSFIRSLIKKDFSAPSEEVTREKLQYELETFKSIDVIAFRLRVSQSQVAKWVKQWELNEYKSLVVHAGSKLRTHKGRVGELAFAEHRGNHITKDMNVEECAQADYDFEDSELGRVNVKSASQHKKGHWNFDAKSMEKCDYLALVCYDPKFQVVQGIYVLPSSSTWKKTCVRFEFKDLSKHDKLSDGTVVLSWRDVK